jgi:hypothetical protein
VIQPRRTKFGGILPTGLMMDLEADRPANENFSIVVRTATEMESLGYDFHLYTVGWNNDP